MSDGADTAGQAPASPPASPLAGPPAGGMRGLIPLAAVTFVGLLGFGIFIPVFPFYGRALGASDGAVTLTMAAYSLGQFISSPFWGRLSDRYGRKPILVGSSLAAALAYVLVANANSIEMLFAARLFGGLMAGNIAAAFAAASDLSTPSTRARAMGLLGAAFGLGFIIGPAIGGEIAGHTPTLHSMANVAYAAAAMNLVAAVAAMLLFRETLTKAAAPAQRTPRWQVMHGKPRLQTLVLVSFLMTVAGGIMESSLGLMTADRLGWSPRDLGHLFALVGVLSVGLQGGAIGALTKRFGESRLLITGLLSTAAGLAVAALAYTDVAIYGAAVLLSLGMAVSNPTISTLASFEAGETERGATLGLVQSAGSLGRVAGPASSGSIYALLGSSAPFLAAAGLTAVCAFLVARAVRMAAGSPRR